MSDGDQGEPDETEYEDTTQYNTETNNPTTTGYGTTSVNPTTTANPGATSGNDPDASSTANNRGKYDVSQSQRIIEAEDQGTFS
jgi:hypothetical protein